MQDKRAELDALRAKRAFEDAERQRRLKEKNELILKQKLIKDLIESNQKQFKLKQEGLIENAKKEEEEYKKIIQREIEEKEKERKYEDERKKLYNEHMLQLKKQIIDKEERNKVNQREILEEGRNIRIGLKNYKERMEKIKKEKIKELEDHGVEKEYIRDLIRYKIK